MEENNNNNNEKEFSVDIDKEELKNQTKDTVNQVKETIKNVDFKKDANATKFQIVLKGDVAKPLKLVKSFKWLALQKDMDAAKEFSDKFIKEQEELAKQELINKMQAEYEKDHKTKVRVQKLLKMDTTAPAVKDFILEEVVKSNKTKDDESFQDVINEQKEIKELEEKIK